MNGYEVEDCENATAFDARVGGLLRADEVANSLLLGLVPELPPGVRYLAVTQAGVAALAGLQQPGRKLLLSRGPAAAAAALAAHLGAGPPRAPGVFAPDENGEAFADAYSRRTGTTVRPGLRMRLHALTAVLAPRRAPGHLRPAGPADLPLLATWARAFVDESGADDSRSGLELVEPPARAGRLLLWDERGPRTMVLWGRPTPAGAAITLVYTPPGSRGRGYASCCVADTSAALLAAGHRFVCLFTDLANPIPNAIYAKLGYRGIGDFADRWFVGS